MNLTPDSWRHARVVQTDEEEYAVRSFYCYSRFGPLSLIALGIDRNEPTDGLSLEAALALGVRIESALVRINSERPPKRPHSKD